MKLAVSPGYVFSPSTQQLTLNIAGFSLSRLYAVINQTTGNQVVYAAGGGAALGCSNVSGSTLTLAASLAGMSPNDTLLVLYDAIGPLAASASLSVTPAIDQSSDDVPGFLVRGLVVEDLLAQVLQELRMTNLLLQQGLNIPDDLNTLRVDLSVTN